ncbi:MAG: DinB family protein [Gemmataceae bacterium]|nr:DinB family protein [Gemmataceae bacterium]
MLDTFRQAIANQFEAALCTLKACIDRCPETAWDAPVGNHAFCRVAFHALFFTDYYLGQNEASFRDQPFHRDHAAFFRDYEELDDREPTQFYDRPTILLYLDHCRSKASTAIAAETVETLTARAGFERRNVSRAELYVYNLRHLYHHTAQLSLRLRIDHQVDIPWIGTGWREV